MRHGRAHRKLGRVADHRVAMLRNQAQDLLRHERIRTTVPRAKELRPFVERIITIAKRSLADGGMTRGVTARRLVARDIHDRAVVVKLFDTIAPRFAERPGGYTRLLRLGHRRGDDAEVAQIELIGSEYNPSAATGKTAGEGAAPAKTKGVGGRLRAAADRLRGKKAEAQAAKSEGRRDAEPKQGKTRATAKGPKKARTRDDE
ncbi:MAG: 50S ribosomal protein L17 [Vicinamibacterales bacterium]